MRLENEKTIVLTKSEEICTLDAETRNQVLLWLNLICKHCGFNEVIAENDKKNKTIETNKSNLNQSRENSELKSEQNIFEKHNKNHRFRNLDTNCLPLLEKQLLIGDLNENNVNNQTKKIAGDASQSVGSFGLCSLNLDKIFTKQVDNELKLANNKREDNYLHLDQFSSGSKNQVQLKENKKNFMLSNNLVSCQSFSSLDNYTTLDQKPNMKKCLIKNQNISLSHILLDNPMFTSNSILQNFKV